MRQKTKNVQNQGLNDKKWIFLSVPKSPTQMGSLCVKNASKKFLSLSTFKQVSLNIFKMYATITKKTPNPFLIPLIP
jgi:hypothetical protein